jgi:hypothetical protein
MPAFVGYREEASQTEEAEDSLTCRARILVLAFLCKPKLLVKLCLWLNKYYRNHEQNKLIICLWTKAGERWKFLLPTEKKHSKRMTRKMAWPLAPAADDRPSIASARDRIEEISERTDFPAKILTARWSPVRFSLLRPKLGCIAKWAGPGWLGCVERGASKQESRDLERTASHACKAASDLSVAS